MGLAPGKNLEFYASVAKLKVRKFIGLIRTFVEVSRSYRGKTGRAGGGGGKKPSWIGSKFL